MAARKASPATTRRTRNGVETGSVTDAGVEDAVSVAGMVGPGRGVEVALLLLVIGSRRLSTARLVAVIGE